MRYSTIEQRLVNRRDQMWSRAAMGRRSTLAGRAVRYPRELRTENHEGLLFQAKLSVGKLLIWLGQQLAPGKVRAITQENVVQVR